MNEDHETAPLQTKCKHPLEIIIRPYEKVSDKGKCQELIYIQNRQLEHNRKVAFWRELQEYEDLVKNSFERYELLVAEIVVQSDTLIIGIMVLTMERVKMLGKDDMEVCYIKCIELLPQYAMAEVKEQLIKFGEFSAKESGAKVMIYWEEEQNHISVNILRSTGYSQTAMADSYFQLTLNHKFKEHDILPIELKNSEAKERLRSIFQTSDLIPYSLDQIIYSTHYKGTIMTLEHIEGGLKENGEHRQGEETLETDKCIAAGASIWENPYAQNCTKFFLSSYILRSLFFRLVVYIAFICLMIFLLNLCINQYKSENYTVLIFSIIFYTLLGSILNYSHKYLSKIIGKSLRSGIVFGIWVSMPTNISNLSLNSEELDLKLKTIIARLMYQIEHKCGELGLFSVHVIIPDKFEYKGLFGYKDPKCKYALTKLLQNNINGKYLADNIFLDPRIF